VPPPLLEIARSAACHVGSLYSTSKENDAGLTAMVGAVAEALRTVNDCTFDHAVPRLPNGP
jgi:hypothetical protein